MTGSPIVIGIHGLNKKPTQATLDRYWRLSIAEGLEKHEQETDLQFDFASAYWANLMGRPFLRDEHDEPADGEINEEPYAPSPREAKASPLRALVEDAITDVQGGFEIAGRILLGRLKSELGFGFDLARFLFNKFAGALLDALLKDLARYYGDDVLREKVQAQLRSVLEDHSDRKIMLVAHSMGSIIAYDVLTQLSAPGNDIEVDRFVTIGSPLGLRYVKQRGEKNPQQPQATKTPNCVKSWVNMGDRRDPVALDIDLANDFAANGRGVLCEDIRVRNDYEIVKPGEKEPDANPHKSYGYLRTPEFAGRVHEFLTT